MLTLLGLKIGHNALKQITAAEFKKLLPQIRGISELDGLEIRFGGQVNHKGKIESNSIEEIVQVCDLIENDPTFGNNLLVLHFSKLGLDICEGNYASSELSGVHKILGKRFTKREFSDYFIDLFDLAVGHCKEHDYLFGRIISESYVQQQRKELAKKGYKKSKSKQQLLRDADELDLGRIDLEKKLIVENGFHPFNCFPEVLSVAIAENKSLCFDIGHFVRALYSFYLPSEIYDVVKKRTAKNPVVLRGPQQHAENIMRYYDPLSKEYQTKILHYWGREIAHLHIHGTSPELNPKVVFANDEKSLIFKDHKPLNTQTLHPDSVHFNILKEFIFGGRASINSATLELNKNYLLRNPAEINPEKLVIHTENIRNSINYFGEVFRID